MFTETFNSCFVSDPYLDDSNCSFGLVQSESEPTKVAITLDEQAWRATLRQLATSFERTRWEIGDHILKAENHFPEITSERVYGHTIPGSNVYIEAERETGLSRALLYDLASTARRCPPSVRTETLSWTHHRILVNNLKEGADADEMKEWLQRAQEERLTTREFKAVIAGGYRAATLEKRFLVRVPLRVWETLKDFGDLKKVLPQKVAADWLVEKSAECQADREEASKAVCARRKAQRRRVGLRVARQYNPLRLDCS